MLSRSMFRHFTCTKLLRSSSKLWTSDCTVAWLLSNSQAEEHMSKEEGEKRGCKCLLSKPESKVKYRQERGVGTKRKDWLAGDDGKGTQSQK